MQDPQILPIRRSPLLLDQRVIGHAEMARGKQLLAIPVLRERPWLAHQPVDHVSVVDPMPIAAAEPGQTLHQVLRVPNFQVLHEHAHLDTLADQPARHRVAIAAHVNQAARIDPGPQPLARLQTPRRQRPQHRPLLCQPLTPPGVELDQQPPQKLGILLPVRKIPAVPQPERLVHRLLEAPMPLFDVPVLMGLGRLNLLRRQPVVRQQRLVTLRELLLVRQVVDRRAQPIRPMPRRHAPQLDERVLQAPAQALEALREADRHRLPVRVRQHEVVHQVVEALPLDRHRQPVHRREIRRAQPPWLVNLREEHLLRRPVQRPPAANVSLQRPQLRVGEAPRVLPLQLVKDRLGL